MDQAYPSFAPQLPPALIEALAEPFSHLDVELRPGSLRQKQPEGTWFCQAVPSVPRWIYEVRLDRLVPGAWSSISPSFVVADDHLTIAVRVQIGSIAHTSYGEMRIPRTENPDSLGRSIASAPDAFTWAFIDACHRFGLGRHLAQLERKWVPYNKERACIALSHEQQREHVLKLYQQAGLPVDLPATPILSNRQAERSTPAPIRSAPTHSSTGTSTLPQALAYTRSRDLAWVRENITGKHMERLLRHFKLTRLEEIKDQDLAAVVIGTLRHQLPKAS